MGKVQKPSNTEYYTPSSELFRIYFWKVFTILDAIMNTRDSWKEVKISTLTGVWKKLIPTLMDDSEGFML
jgi:hypothetical protein